MTSDEGQEQGPGPGEHLRRAREAMGRSPEDMALELRLSEDQIRSLEAEAFHRLPGEAYVRGYLRNYAAAVGVAPEEIIAAYYQLSEGGGEAGGEGEAPLVPAPERPLIEHPWRVVWVSLALLVVVTVVTLWLVGESREPSLPEGATSEAESATSSGTENATSAASAEADGEVFDGEGRDEAPAEPAAGQEARPEAPASRSSAPEPSPDQPESGIQAGGDNGPAAADGQPETETEAARPEGPALTGPGLEGPSLPELPGTQEEQIQPGDLQMLRVHTWGDSWLEVADDRGRTLLRRLVEGGRDVRLYGQAPFQVKVGNAAGVQLYFEGEPLAPLGGPGEVVGLTVDADSRTIPESEVAAPEKPEPESEGGRPVPEASSPAADQDTQTGPSQGAGATGEGGAGAP